MPVTVPIRAGLDPAALEAAAHDLGSRSITFVVDGEPVTYRCDGITFATAPGGIETADAVVSLSAEAWEHYVQQLRSFVNLHLSGQLAFERGAFSDLADWDPPLTQLHAGVPIYDPARADLGGFDPDEAVTLDHTDEELRARLTALGYLRVRGVFGPEEMEEANAEVDRLAALARPGDDESWWATAESGDKVLCRLIYATLRSPLLARLEHDERVQRLGTLLDDAHRVAPDRMEGTSVLIKQPGRTDGLSNIPWHQDCGMGGHAILCPNVSVGIQLTGSTAGTGNLKVVPGSHGQTLHLQWENRLLDAPVVEIDTQPGDVTVHIADVMHESPRPTGGGGRRTMYVTYYPPTLWDHVGPGEAFNDLVRSRTEEVARLGRRR
jgi:hypothetical protein